MKTVEEYAKDHNTPASQVVMHMFKMGTPVTLRQLLTKAQIQILDMVETWPQLTKKGNTGMSSMHGNSRNADKFVVRLSDGLRERIAAIAQGKHRSMNGQLLQWLELCVELEENSESGINPDELKALMIETRADPKDAIVISVSHVNYTPAPGTPVRIKNGGVWVVRNYTAREGVVVAWLECFINSNQPVLLDVGVDQLEPL